MIHVPDVRAAVEWYRSIGFEVRDIGEVEDEASFALLSFGEGRVMFNEGRSPSDAHRREVDLYVETEKVDEIFNGIKDRLEVFEPPHDTFYGMREFIIRDLNRFWITFGEPT